MILKRNFIEEIPWPVHDHTTVKLSKRVCFLHMLLYYFGQCLCRKIIFFTSQVWSHTTDGICCSCLTYNKRCLVEMVLTICDVLKDTKVECIKPETSQSHIQQFCVLQKFYLKWTGQNRRQKVSNGRDLHLCRGAWHWKFDKTPLTYTASHFNLRGLGTSTGGLRPPRPPWQRDWNRFKNNIRYL